MTTKEAAILIRELKRVFDVVRLVDVDTMVPYALDEAGTVTAETHHCYEVWNKDSRCDNCISAKAMMGKTRLSKYEFIDQDVHHVVAKYVEINERPFVLEVVFKVTDSILFGAFGEDSLVERIKQQNRKLYADPLTGAYNREYYEEQFRIVETAHALAMIDLDNFKSINDTYGHFAGDLALRLVVQVLKNNIRPGDAVIRYGGDEFLVVFQKMPRGELERKLEHLRRLIEEARIPEYPEVRITVSIGGSNADEQGSNRILQADRRMYRAKNKKNAVCCD